jgi:predicted ferric reductase
MIFILAILVPGLSYTPTSCVFINVPSISKLQWHPFSITSSSKMDLDKLSVVIKSKGSWSQKMYQMLSSPSPMDRMEVSIEGPYGPPSTHFLKVFVYTHLKLFPYLKLFFFLSKRQFSVS